MRKITCFVIAITFIACSNFQSKEDHQILEVARLTSKPNIDGKGTETNWSMSPWRALDQNWVGPAFDREDFKGRYKIAWDPEALYLLVEIEDDSLFDQHSDPLKFWWDDDCVEIFIDEDNSGGLHQFNHNAFAYHVALDGNVVDLGTDREPHLYNDHVKMARQNEGGVHTWEMVVYVFDDSFTDGIANEPVILEEGKKLGFALAYCDNDGSAERENFIGSVFVPGEDKNQGWINADIFGTLILK